VHGVWCGPPRAAEGARHLPPCLHVRSDSPLPRRWGALMAGVLPREVHTHTCSVCGERGCTRLVQLVESIFSDPRAERDGMHLRPIPPEALGLMERTAHDLEGGLGDMGAMRDAAARRAAGGGGGDGQRRIQLDSARPWNLEVLRRQLGSNNIEELAQRVNEPNEKIRLMAMVKAGGNVDEATALLESEGEARAQQIGAGAELAAEEQMSKGIAPPALCTAVVRGDEASVAQQLTVCSGGGSGGVHGGALTFVTEERSVNAEDDWDLLRVAAVEGHVGVGRLLLAAGAEVERLQRGSGRTALYSAASAGSLEGVRWLHEECGADLCAPDDFGATPIWAASAHGHTAVVGYMLERGADLPMDRRLKALTLLGKVFANCLNDPGNAKFKRLKTTNGGVRKLLAAGFEGLLCEAGFQRTSHETLEAAEIDVELVGTLRAKVLAMAERLQPRQQGARVQGAPVGARVVRGPDWQWQDQDAGGMGTVVEASRRDEQTGEVWEARVQWDRARPNVYRTGMGSFDLAYAPGETWETPLAAAKRLGLPAVQAIHEAAQWWQQEDTSAVMRVLDGTLQGEHPGSTCTSCGMSPIRGVRSTCGSLPAGDSARDVCEACFTGKQLRQTAAYQRQHPYRRSVHPALTAFETHGVSPTGFCKAHSLYDLVSYLEVREERTLVRAKQRLRWAQGLREDPDSGSVCNFLNPDTCFRVAQWLDKGAQPTDYFVLRALQEEADGGSRAQQQLVALNLQLRPEMHVAKAWLEDNALPDIFLRHIGACERVAGEHSLFPSGHEIDFDGGVDDAEAAVGDSVPEGDAPASPACGVCDTLLVERGEPDDEYYCSLCEGSPTLWTCSQTCDYDVCATCYATLCQPEKSDMPAPAPAEAQAEAQAQGDVEEGSPSARVVSIFESRIIEWRRIRQLADHRRWSRCLPQFCDGGPEIEKQTVQSRLMPQMMQNGWDVNGAIMQLWAGELDPDVLTAGLDPDSAALVRLIVAADDEEYRQLHERACKKNKMHIKDPDRPASAMQYTIPEPEPESQNTGTAPQTAEETVAELFDFISEMATGDAPDGVRPLEWLRFTRCAKALPHKAARVRARSTQPQSGAGAGGQSANDFASWLEDLKLGEYHEQLEEVLGMILSDAPFLEEDDLLPVIGKPFHRKRLVRSSKKLLLTARQLDHYGDEWRKVTTEKYVVASTAAIAAKRGRLDLFGNAELYEADRQFENNINAWRRIRQLIDPQYAMSAQARFKCQGRLCDGGCEAERQHARQRFMADEAPALCHAVEQMWAGESNLAVLQATCTSNHERRMVQLVWHADEDEFDDDVRVTERAMFGGEKISGGAHDGDLKAVFLFKDELVKFRRIRQLADLEEARYQHPSFEPDTPEAERDFVRQNILTRYERMGWVIRKAVERIWAGERRLRDLVQTEPGEETVDPNSAMLIKLILSADADGLRVNSADMAGTHGSGRDTSTWARARPSVEQEMASRGEEATDSSVSHHANSEAVQELVSFTGKSEEQVIMCLQLAEGDKGAAAAMLLES
jgi:hypothetical protein